MTTRVPIRYGGTGANNAADARAALGVLANTGGTVDGDLNITGNLTVSGNTTTLNVETLQVEDNEIVLNFGATTATLNAGIIVNRGSEANVFVRWNEDANTWGWSDDGNTFYSFDTALTAYGQANLAYDQANTAANTVRVSQNSGSTLSAKQLNFVNTANVTITVTDSGDGNANVEIFSAAGGGAGIADFPVSANTGSTVTANALNFNNTSSVIVSVATGIDGNANISFTSVGAAANLEILDEGSSITAAVTSIDFVGPGVSATANGSDVTVTISGGGGGSNTIIGSDLFTSVNADANLTYTLSEAVPGTNYVFVVKNGISLTPGVDYVVEPDYQTLRVIESGAANDSIEVRYFTPLSAVLVPNTTIVIDSNTVTSQTNTFFLTSNVTDITLLTVTKNGLFLTPNSHFTLSDNNTVTLTTIAEVDDELVFRYFRDQGIDEVSNNSVSSVFTANGVSNTYFMNSFALDANNVLVTIDGVVLTPGVDYSVSGPVLTINYVPAANSVIESRTITGGGDGSPATLGFYRNSFVGDGNTVNFTLEQTPYDEDNCLVFVDRVLQRNSEYNVSATTLTFTGAPDANAVVDVFVTNYLATNKALIKTGDTMTGNLNVAATLITQNVEPAANITYDLGTPTKRFKDLWLSNSTIYLGEATISANGGNLSFGNTSIQLSNVEAKLNVNNDAYFSGNVGIGVENANNALHIEKAGTSGAYDELFRVRGGPDISNNTGASIGIFQKDNSRGLVIRAGRGTGDQAKADFILNKSGGVISSANQNTIMTMLGNGNIGIGTTVPGSDVSMTGGLEINGSDSTQFTISRNGVRALAINVNGSANGDVSIFDKVGGGYNYALYLNRGNVVVGGITTPSCRLHVVSPNGDIARFAGANENLYINTDTQGSYIGDGAAATGEFIYFNAVNDYISISTSTAERVRIANNGNIGIGVTNPNGKLQFANDVNTRKIVLYEGGNNDYQFYGFGIESAKLIYSVFSTGDDHVFYNGTSSTARQELMRINSTHKALQVPGQPGFKQAWQSRNFTGSSRILGTNQGDSLATGRDEFNQGNYFSTATGRFTCPVAGMYTFGISTMRNVSNGSEMDIRIKKNGSEMWARTYASAYTSSYQQSIIVTITDAAVNDYFEFQIGATTSIYDDDTYTYGYLIG